MEPIAIVGMSGRFPGASSVDEFWANLREGVESISSFSPSELAADGTDPAILEHPAYVNARGVIDAIDLFDAAFFGFSPRSAASLNPQHRIFLECAWEALESAGYDPSRHKGRIAVFAGASTNGYGARTRSASSSQFAVIEAQLGNENDSLASRAAYKLNLRGPAVTVQTTCSTSLVAIVLAARALESQDCDMALAGGVRIAVPHRVGYMHWNGGIHSPDGHCRAFDAAAAGTVSGNGCGVVLLKRLADALADRDMIHATIVGGAYNNDGSDKVGFTAPSVSGQADVIARAHRAAGVTPDDISYVECHGTGTPLGDPIELQALSSAFGPPTNGEKNCAIGSVKTNIGHLDVAAGVAGLIKTVLALQHDEIPPSLHFRAPNPESCLDASRFFVNTEVRAWRRGEAPRRAGVSSFGMGGTNAHLVLEEAPPRAAGSAGRRHSELVVISAKTPAALDAATRRLASRLSDLNPDLFADAAYTLQIGRKEFPHRRVAIAASSSNAALLLQGGDLGRASSNGGIVKRRGVAFLFPGQGAQYPAMAAELYDAEPVFREHFDCCAELLSRETGVSLIDLLYRHAKHSPSFDLTQTVHAQPALFAVEYALAQLWMSWGVTPAAVLGHSVGEFAAAAIAGVMSLAIACRLVGARGRAMQACAPGAMLAVGLSESDVRQFLSSDIDLAAVNTRARCTLAGSIEAVTELEALLRDQGVPHRRLNTSRAFHSESMEPAAQHVRASLRGMELKGPEIPMVCGATGDWLTEATAKSDYWATQIRQTVRFANALDTVTDGRDIALLEVGPGATLSGLARQHLSDPARRLILCSLSGGRSKGSETESLWRAVASLWLDGQTIDWTATRRHELRRRVHLPTYPFERRRFWVDLNTDDPIEAVKSTPARAVSVPAGESRPDPVSVLVGSAQLAPDDLRRVIADIWQTVLGVNAIEPGGDFFLLGGDSLLALQVAARVRAVVGVDAPASLFFEARTVDSLVVRILGLKSSRRNEEIGALLDQVEALTDDEVRALLARERAT